ncbi:MAG TPA: 30S ribosomal protein S20 [Pirellulales bacterium]|jgi:small subunit ribosomal protein S20|nr:30S ribosomal protein S20 [Pirellulales bacterium]
MPNTASAKKRLRQSLVRRTRNRAVKSTLKGLVRKVRESVTGGDLPAAEAGLRLAAKKLDQAAAKNVIHANAAARLKSRLSGAIKRAKQQTAG